MTIIEDDHEHEPEQAPVTATMLALKSLGIDNDPQVLAKVLDAMASGSNAQQHRHHIVLRAAADALRALDEIVEITSAEIHWLDKENDHDDQ